MSDAQATRREVEVGDWTVGSVVGTLPLSVVVTVHDSTHRTRAALGAKIEANDCDPAITGESPEEQISVVEEREARIETRDLSRTGRVGPVNVQEERRIRGMRKRGGTAVSAVEWMSSS